LGRARKSYNPNGVGLVKSDTVQARAPGCAEGKTGVESRPILVTGAAGFIGMHTARRLLEQGRSVVGIDNLNDHCDPALKQARLAELRRFPSFQF